MPAANNIPSFSFSSLRFSDIICGVSAVVLSLDCGSYPPVLQAFGCGYPPCICDYNYLRAHRSLHARGKAITKVVINQIQLIHNFIQAFYKVLNSAQPFHGTTQARSYQICSMLSHLGIRLSIGRVVVLLGRSLVLQPCKFCQAYSELRSSIRKETCSGRHDLLNVTGLGLSGVPSVSDLKPREAT